MTGIFCSQLSTSAGNTIAIADGVAPRVDGPRIRQCQAEVRLAGRYLRHGRAGRQRDGQNAGMPPADVTAGLSSYPAAGGTPRRRGITGGIKGSFMASWGVECRFGGGHFVAGVRAGQRPVPDDKRE